MSESPEIETDKLRENIEEELKRDGGRLLRGIALTTALFAAVAAVAALRAGGTANEALMLESQATRLQAEASDQWSYYQAKGIKAAVQEAARTSWLAAGREAPPEYLAAQKRYGEEQAQIQKKAREMEHERDARAAEAKELLHHHHIFANCVALFQVAIALGAIAALVRNRWIWIASLSLGIVAIAIFLMALG